MRQRFPLMLAAVLLSGCMQVPESSEKPVRLIFETDMGNDVDDALALDMIYKYMDEGTVDLLAVCTNKTDVESAEYLDIMSTWYGYEDIPLGRVKRGIEGTNRDFPFARLTAELKNEDGTPKYSRSVSDYDALPEAWKLYRKVLSEAEDSSVTVASVGFATNLAQLLESGPDEYSPLDGRELVGRKVKLLSIMGGFFADTVTLEYNVTIDKPSTQRLLADWPTRMVFSPAELGLKVWYPGTQIRKDFSWAGDAHPMVDGYTHYFGDSYDRPCWDLTSVLYAVEGGDLFTISEPGTVTMDEGGVTRFTPDPEGRMYVLSVDDSQAEAQKNRFVELTHRIPEAYLKRYPYKDSRLPASERAEDLLKRLTLEQKASLMSNDSPAIPEFGIRKYNWWSEALHGVAEDTCVTVFPQNIGMAASFDTALVRQIFDAVGTEQRVRFSRRRREAETGIFEGLTVWTPNINIFRDPRWGRGQETYGEDPFLTAMMGYNVVSGLQGQPSADGYDKLHACLKHYAVHSGPESRRHVIDVEDLSLRDLRETYLYAFEHLVRSTDVQEVMCAYNRFEGAPCCGSDRLLTQLLRDEWGYKGMVVSDCWAIDDFHNEGKHNIYPSDPESSAARALISGTDLECGSGTYMTLVQAVQDGKVEESVIDNSVRRLLTARFRLGEMDSEESVSWNRISADSVASPAHHEMALRMARESMVLLANDGILPLKKGTRVAVKGPNADFERAMWGNYNGKPVHTVTVLEGISDKAEVADDADTVIYVGGIDSTLESEESPLDCEGFFGGDRTSIELPRQQREEIAALRDAGKTVILVNMSGSAMGLVPETEVCPAILQAWYGGEAGGEAVADILFGDFNPGGKLPVTFYRSDADLPDFENYDMEGRTYRYFDGEPLFPFGYGLSYTTFSVGEAKISGRGTFKAGRRLDLCVPVTNTGAMDGTETVQMYVRRDEDTGGPRLSLRGFDKVSVKAGETVLAHIAVDDMALTTFDEESGRMALVPGSYTLLYGTDSQNLKEIKLRIK